MALENKTKTTNKTGNSGLSDKALAMRKERLLKEQEQKKKMVYMIIGPGAVLIGIVLIIKLFMGSGDATKKKIKYKKRFSTTQNTPVAARPQMKKALAMVDKARGLIKQALTSSDSKVTNQLKEQASEILSNALEMISDLSDKYPGEWAQAEMQHIQTLMYECKKTTTLNYY